MVDRDMQDANLRLEMVLAAREAGDANYLAGALKDPDNRHLAALYLGQLGVLDAAPAIVLLLDASNPLARANASQALGMLSYTPAAPKLAEVALADTVPYVRAWAVQALGLLEREAAVPILLKLLNDPEWRVRLSAVSTLGTLGDQSCVGQIDQARRREPPFSGRRHAYRKALRAIRASGALALSGR